MVDFPLLGEKISGVLAIILNKTVIQQKLQKTHLHPRSLTVRPWK